MITIWREFNHSTETTKVWYARSKNRYTVFYATNHIAGESRTRERLLARGSTGMEAELDNLVPNVALNGKMR